MLKKLSARDIERQVAAYGHLSPSLHHLKSVTGNQVFWSMPEWCCGVALASSGGSAAAGTRFVHVPAALDVNEIA